MNRRIAYLTSSYARAGDTFIRREVEELRRRGWIVHTFSIRRADEGERVSEEIAREQRTTDYVLEHGAARLLVAFAQCFVRSPGRMLRAIRRARAIRPPGLRAWAWHWFYLLEASYLAERLVRLDIGLLHDHISMNSATVAMLASTLSGVPYTMTVHGPHDFFEADRWGLGAKVASSSATLCISEFGRSQCMLFTPPEHWDRLRVVRCGLDDAFLDAPPVPAPDTPRLVCIGRLSPEKGQLLLVEAAGRLRDGGIEVEIVLVGDGPARGDIERAAQRLGLEGRIRLAGWQGEAEVRAWIARSRAVVAPSFAEGIPVVLMEAMALGRPVIATCVGGVPELVRPGENGWLVPAGSVEELVSALRELLGTPAHELERMGQLGRARVRERHDLSVEVEKLAGVFEQVIQESFRVIGTGSLTRDDAAA